MSRFRTARGERQHDRTGTAFPQYCWKLMSDVDRRACEEKLNKGSRLNTDMTPMAPLAAAGAAAPVAPFGETPDGHRAALYTLQNQNMRVRITDYGGRIVSVEAPDRTGRHDHVLLGFDGVAEYVDAKGAFGAVLGRTANRIAGGRFTLNGRSYDLSKNEGDYDTARRQSRLR